MRCRFAVLRPLALASAAVVAAAPSFAQTFPARESALPSFSQPAVSPDGSEIAFVHGGDIWTVPSSGGTARLLAGGASDDSRPLFSPDGTRVAFQSDRAGGDSDIYVLTLASGEVHRLTYGDGNEELDAWSPDGKWIYFADGRGDPGGHPDIWRVAGVGGTPMRVLADVYAPEFHAAVSPDGATIAFAARARMAQGQWWRHGHSHIDESEIWLATPGDPPSYRRLSERGAKNLWPMWTSDGAEVLYMSDRSGEENLWARPAAGGPARQVTRFRDGRLLWPTISADGHTVAFERDFRIWRLRLPDGTPEPVSIELGSAPAASVARHLRLTSGFSDLALSPDGRKVAFAICGEVFAASAADGGDAARVTRTLAAESGVTWAPDSHRIAYVSERDGDAHIFLYDFTTGSETRLTSGKGDDFSPRFSPDGLKLAYLHDGTEVRVRDLDSGKDVRLAAAQLARYPFTLDEPLAWSPDGRWIAFFASDARMFTNVWLVPSEGGEPRAASGLANTFAGSMAWSPDGQTLFFDTQQRTKDGRIARVDLVPRTPVFREDRFSDLFREKEQKPDSGKGSAVAGEGRAGAPETGKDPVFEGIRRRLSLLPTGVDVGVLALSPDGKTLVFTASAEGQQNLYAFSVDPLAKQPVVARQITSTPGAKSRPQFTPDGKEVFYLDRGKIHEAQVVGGKDRSVAVTAEMDEDFDAQKVEAFHQAWTYLDEHFYDADFHGADWAAVRARFEPRIRGARTRAEYSRLMNLMLGELDSSHMGHRLGRGSEGSQSGALGVRLDRGAYESSGALRVLRVITLGPAAIGRVRAGEYITAVDGAATGVGVNLEALLENTVGRKVTLRVASAPDGTGARDVTVRPVSASQERRLAYRDWVERNRAYVDSLSGGRLGYVHMPDMGWGSYQQLLVDLDAENHEKEGVVVDIRNNNGGFVNAYALDVFARKGYITMQIRGYPEAPARSMLGQRALQERTVLVVNQHTLSDGEDFTEGYRALGLGKVVGEPTAGWIIYTWSLRLVDGTTLRMPRARIRGADGRTMEMSPRPVDVEVVRPMGESYTGRDAQLDAAVRVLLGG